ncbi:YihY/virulence factor BrkB family protein [Gulosibacter sp. 10]|uniref:YihY/virulence factor BrkB family protein n=1 Tax=Gulosibacter sp. 10 TaxID=1255570 RepID=UPI00097F3576|nr:YihY/virulence factor BrkB family protein [Gulosibacter sp. 10]SJM47783.1 putative integral membrane protein [Gulosibacter sp. 10]
MTANSEQETGDQELTTTRATILPPFPTVDEDAGAQEKVKATATWVQATRPMRAVQHWSSRRGTTLAGGMAYSGLFSGFAAILVFFSVAGIVLSNNQQIMQAMIEALDSTVPGLVGENGVVSAEDLMTLNQTTSLTVAGAIALVSALWTALNFLNGARLSIRAMFDLPTKIERSFVKMKLVDLGLLVLFALGLIISVTLTAASSGIMSWLLNDFFALELSGFTTVLIRIVTIAVALLFDSVVIAGMLRVLSEVLIPAKTLWTGALLGGFLVMVLKQLGSMLLGGASSNPLLATFAALLGVLIFINFLCMVLLFTAAWVKVTMDDLGQSPRRLTYEEAEEITRQTELEARRERLATDLIHVREELAHTPRWRRRRLRREFERIVDEQRRLEEDELERRMGYVPVEAHAERKDLDPEDVELKRPER